MFKQPGFIDSLDVTSQQPSTKIIEQARLLMPAKHTAPKPAQTRSRSYPDHTQIVPRSQAHRHSPSGPVSIHAGVALPQLNLGGGGATAGVALSGAGVEIGCGLKLVVGEGGGGAGVGGERAALRCVGLRYLNPIDWVGWQVGGVRWDAMRAFPAAPNQHRHNAPLETQPTNQPRTQSQAVHRNTHIFLKAAVLGGRVTLMALGRVSGSKSRFSIC